MIEEITFGGIIASIIAALYHFIVNRPGQKKQDEKITEIDNVVAAAIRGPTNAEILEDLRKDAESNPLPTPSEAFYLLQRLGVHWIEQWKDCKGTPYKYMIPKEEGVYLYEGPHYTIQYRIVHEGNIPTIDILRIVRIW